MTDAEKKEKLAARRRLAAKRLPSRALGEARRLEHGKMTPGKIWRRVDELHRSDAWEDRPSVLLSGLKGTGKTTALCTLGGREIIRGRSVWYLPITRLPRIIKSHPEMKPQLSHLESCDLLLLDELHRFPDLPAWVRAEGVALIDHRYGAMLQTCAAGTLPEKMLGSAIGLEVMERFDILIDSEEGSFR